MKKIIKSFIIFIFIFSFSACSCNKEKVNRGEIYVPMVKAYLSKNINGAYTLTNPFGTVISLVYFYESELDKASAYFQSEYIRLHQLFDRHYYYFDNEGSLINNLRVINESNNEPIKVSDELIEILNEGIRFTKLSKGKFNVGVGNISSLWDNFIEYGNIHMYYKVSDLTFYNYINGEYISDAGGSYISVNGVYFDTSEMLRYNLIDSQYVEAINGEYLLIANIAPTFEQINQAKLCTPNYNEIENYIVIDENNKTVTLINPSECNSKMTITLGALAKSYTAEKIASSDELKNGNFLINAGQSTIKILGKNLLRDNGVWNVGVTDSYLAYKLVVKNPTYSIKIANPKSISTSSGDERHYRYKDNYYHHIIDPISGYPNQNRFAVTAVTNNAMYADIITTSLMSMNMNETKEFLQGLKSIGIDTEIFIQDKDQDSVKVYASKSLKEYTSVVTPTNTSLQDYFNSIVIEELSYDS